MMRVFMQRQNATDLESKTWVFRLYGFFAESSWDRSVQGSHSNFIRQLGAGREGGLAVRRVLHCQHQK
jgi:hypothetical protein